MGGSDLANQIGTYRTLGTPARGNIPGARGQAVAWTDASGNFWLFGGEGYHSAGTVGYLNDLWKYSGGEWTWMGGSDLANQSGTYGTLGAPAPGNVPGARYYRPDAWTDASGNLWLFGGDGYDSAGKLDRLNDLWKYEP
jgi:N-acetylneuraminic acid mutarotase